MRRGVEGRKFDRRGLLLCLYTQERNSLAGFCLLCVCARMRRLQSFLGVANECALFSDPLGIFPSSPRHIA